jgi:hypothetical protein
MDEKRQSKLAQKLEALKAKQVKVADKIKAIEAELAGPKTTAKGK